MAADPRVRLPIFITTAHVYLDDITDEIGPTVIVPGSHRSGRAPDLAQDASCRNDRSRANAGAAAPSQPELEWNGVGEHSPLCKAGDCLFFRCELWHRGAANRSDRIRHTFMIHYAHRMIAQKFPPYLKFRFDPEIVAPFHPAPAPPARRARPEQLRLTCFRPVAPWAACRPLPARGAP